MVDIIIPVYNTPIADLERCLSSIICQHYGQWRITLVDDGSERDLAVWLDSNYGQNSQIQIIHTKNNGVSSARNIGLSYSSGEYVAFCDADDTCSPLFLEHAVSLMERYNLDFVAGGCRQIQDGTIQDMCCLIPPEELWIYEGEQIHSLIDYMLTELHRENNRELGNIYLGSVWTKVYRRSALKGIQFDTSVRMSEDMLFNLEYMLRCGRMGLTPEVWYTYYRNSYSATHKERATVAQQQISFSNAVNRYRVPCRAANVENALNICLFWKMEYCLRTVFLQRELHFVKAMRKIMAYEFFAEAIKLRTNGYLEQTLRKRLLFWIIKCPRCLHAWLFEAYYMVFYALSWFIHHFKRSKSRSSGVF